MLIFNVISWLVQFFDALNLENDVVWYTNKCVYINLLN